MNKTISILALTALLFAPSIHAEAQQPPKIPRIGYIQTSGNARGVSPTFEAFRQGLRDRGYIDRKNVTIERRYAEGDLDRASALVLELIKQNVDVIVVAPLRAIQTAKQASKTTPIVMVTGIDPVAEGLVDSLSRPGSNITGVTRLTRELGGKRLEILKEITPRISRVGVLWDAGGSGSAIGFREYESAGRALNMDVQSFDVRGPNPDFESRFGDLEKKRIGALIVIHNLLMRQHQERIVDLVTKQRLAAIYEEGEWVEGGGLVYYGADFVALYRRAAAYVDKILKGAKPTDLPVEQPRKFELIVNLKAAKQIGLTIPESVLYRADKVIK